MRVTRDQKLAEEWQLALLAQGLSPSLSWTSEGFVLTVPGTEVERALVGLSVYERENPRELDVAKEPAQPPDLVTGAAVAGMVLLFFVITEWQAALPWFARGSADADRILGGEFWRIVTALTLHADLAHVLSNAVGIALFLSILSSMLGPGLASALVLLAGAGGNLVNGFVHGGAHVSVGASTAVFGAVGMLGGLGLASHRRKSASRRAWLTVAAALALLAMLGTGGERVDVLAHFFGFLSGVVLGLLCAFIAPHPPARLVQWICGGAALAVLFGCWLVAFF
ncbi:MAG: rhomboid family intramembrane serine protease [Candidatus Binatia bacterium]